MVRSISIFEQVSAKLGARILRGELPPGRRLVEQQLARSLGVGQNAIREALIQLSHRGFVRRVANRGTYITSLRSRKRPNSPRSGSRWRAWRST